MFRSIWTAVKFGKRKCFGFLKKIDTLVAILTITTDKVYALQGSNLPHAELKLAAATRFSRERDVNFQVRSV